ncbi:MAG: AsmA family protein [Treponema sp.]|nr:AsmA family protein [Treponema sp.]
MLNKVIKRIIIIFLSVILAIFLVLLITPILFKNQIMELAKTELNKMLTAKVDFKDLKISFIRSFPSAYVALEGLEIIGIDDFEDELLVSFNRFSVTADLLSLIRMEKIEVKSILLDRARLNGHILEDGRANWEIFPVPDKEIEPDKPTETPPAEEKEAAPLSLNVGLNKFEIRNMEIVFRDDVNKMKAEIEAFNFILRGDMRKENVDLKMNLGIDGINFWLDGIRLANNANVGFVSQIAADLKNMSFLIKDNRFNLNDIILKFAGFVEMKEDDINVDVTFETERTDFKSLLSLVPAIYMNDFKDLRTTGSLELNGDIKGTYNENIMPSANLNLFVNNAMFSYPDLPKSVEKVNIALKVHYDGEVFDRTTVDLDRFNFEMAGNPFNIGLHLKTPESDLQVAAKFAGKIDFDSVADIVPLDDINLNGLLECDITLAGRLSTIEKEQYEDFQADGHLKISGFDFESPDFPQGVKITNMQLNFNPRFVELASFDIITGNTDISMNGSLENFIPFIFKNETVKGTLALRSNKIDLNQIMSALPAKSETPAVVNTEEKTPLAVIEVPKNIDFALNVNIGNILFDKLEISNTRGAVLVRDGRIVMQNLGMNLLDGSLVLNGEYNTQNIKVPFINFDMNIRQFDITSAVSSFSLLENFLPNPENYSGKVSAALNLQSTLDEDLSPVLDSVSSRGRIQTHNLELRNSPLFGTLATLLQNEGWRTPSLNNIDIGYVIRDGRLWLEDPIIMDLQTARFSITGDQGLDMTMNYRIDATMPTSAIGNTATDLLGRIPGGSRVNEFKLTGYMRGNVNNPDVNLSMADTATAITTAVRDQVTETINIRVDEARTQVNEELNRQIDSLMAEAQRQADNIRSTAKTSADRVRAEANNMADNLISEAAGKNIIERRLAESAADLLRSEGETNARRLEQEGENQARSIMSSANTRADELRRN